MVPQSGQKISSPPTSSEWCQRLMAPQGFQVFHLQQAPTWYARRQDIPKNPQQQLPTKHAAQREERKSKGLANRKCMTSFSTHTSHWASPQSQFYWGGISDWWCLFLARQANHFWVRGAERKLLSIYKLTVPNTERCENRHYSWTVGMFLFAISTPLMPQVCQTYYLTFHFVNNRFQRKALKRGIIIMPQQYYSFCTPKKK